MIGRDDRLYYPTHGAPIRSPLPFVRAVKAHRLARDEAILAALAQGGATPDAIVAAVYEGLDPALRTAAALNVTAHLLMHLADGRVAAAGLGRYALA
nr:hypothetical protein [Parvularcula dongshanensis]